MSSFIPHIITLAAASRCTAADRCTTASGCTSAALIGWTHRPAKVSADVVNLSLFGCIILLPSAGNGAGALGVAVQRVSEVALVLCVSHYNDVLRAGFGVGFVLFVNHCKRV